MMKRHPKVKRNKRKKLSQMKNYFIKNNKRLKMIQQNYSSKK